MAAESTEGKFTTIVRLESMLGLMPETEVVLMVRGLGLVFDAVFRLWHVAVVLLGLPSNMQLKGVIAEGKTGSTTIR